MTVPRCPSCSHESFEWVCVLAEASEPKATGPREREASDDPGQKDRYERALRDLMVFAKRLMASESEDERAIGCCVAECARVVEEEDAPYRSPPDGAPSAGESSREEKAGPQAPRAERPGG